MELVLRQAQRGDAAYVAWGLNEAADGLFASLLGGSWQHILETTIDIPGHDFSLEHVTIAEQGGAPIGVLSGMAVETMRDPSGPLARAAGVRIARAAVVALALLPTLRALGRHSPGEWYLQAVAVSEQARGLGVGAQLLDLAESRARSDGATAITLDVAVTNTGGRRLYERVGYMEQWTSSTWPGVGDMAVHRMRKELAERPAS